MTLKKIAVEGDEVEQSDAHCPGCAGGGSYPVSPVTMQAFVYIAGKPVICDTQQYSAHGTATVIASSTLLFINGVAVARDLDVVDHHHSNDGIRCIGQAFMWG